MEPKYASTKESSRLPPPKQVSSNDSGLRKHPPLVYAWVPDADYFPPQLEEKEKEQILEGIIEIGKLWSQTNASSKSAQKFLESNETADKINDSIVFLMNIFQERAFIFEAVNKALREEDLSRSRTFGPLAYIINECISFHSDHSGKDGRWHYRETVYKGVTLSQDGLNKYKNIAKSSFPVFCWNGFVCASKDFDMARSVGNVLFIISMSDKDCGAMDAIGFPYFGNDEQVLFPAASRFKITEIEGDSIIYLQRIPLKDALPPKITTPIANSAGEKRLLKEWTDIKNELNNSNAFNFYDVFIIPSRESFYEWKALIPGPRDTCYDGAMLQADIKVPSDYPFKAPETNFVSKVWHPNVSAQTGKVCMDILSEDWSPQLRVIAIAVSVQSLLSEWNVEDPIEVSAANQMKTNYGLFKQTVESYSKNGKVIGEKVKDLMYKGASAQKAKLALMIADFNEDIACGLCEKSVDELVEIWWQSIKGWKM